MTIADAIEILTELRGELKGEGDPESVAALSVALRVMEDHLHDDFGE